MRRKTLWLWVKEFGPDVAGPAQRQDRVGEGGQQKVPMVNPEPRPEGLVVRFTNRKGGRVRLLLALEAA